MLILSEDRLALLRKAPVTNLLLQTTADLIAGALANQRLVATLEDTNRVLGALSRISSAVLRPGATRQQVLEAIVQLLTDAQVPEFDFQFATAYLLDDADGSADVASEPPDSLVVRLAAGAATAPTIVSTVTANGQTRVPSWVQVPNRALAADDILAYVARNWQTVVVGAVPSGKPEEETGGEIMVRYPPDQLRLAAGLAPTAEAARAR